MNLFDLAGKVALITGSTKGIGEAIAHRMAEHGAKVVVSSRKADACDKVAGDINKERGAKVAVPIPCNINYKEQLQMLVDETHKQLGKIDILVCNAALNPAYGPMSKIADDALEKKDGAIIIVSSIGGYRGSPVIGTYCISKAADIQLARNLAIENGPSNIRVNCIAPGLVKTVFARALWDTPEAEQRSSFATPLPRLGEPDDIAGAAVFLAGKSGAWMTGQTVVVDGGSTS